MCSPQWDASENAGFSKGKPWMRVHDDYKEWNVEAQRKDPKSVWTFWKRMLQLRKDYEALVYGEYHQPLHVDCADFKANSFPSMRPTRRSTRTSEMIRLSARSSWLCSTWHEVEAEGRR